jgi:hypothetical protein
LNLTVWPAHSEPGLACPPWCAFDTVAGEGGCSLALRRKVAWTREPWSGKAAALALLESKWRQFRRGEHPREFELAAFCLEIIWESRAFGPEEHGFTDRAAVRALFSSGDELASVLTEPEGGVVDAAQRGVLERSESLLGRRPARNVRGCRDALTDPYTGLEGGVVEISEASADPFTGGECSIVEPTERVGLDARDAFADPYTGPEGWLLKATDYLVVNAGTEISKTAAGSSNGFFGREDAFADALTGLECCSVQAAHSGVFDGVSAPTESAAELEGLLVQAAEGPPGSLAGLKRRVIEPSVLLSAACDGRAECGPGVVDAAQRGVLERSESLLGRRPARNVRGCRDALTDPYTGLEGGVVEISEASADALTGPEGWLVKPPECRLVHAAAGSREAATRPPDGLLGADRRPLNTTTGFPEPATPGRRSATGGRRLNAVDPAVHPPPSLKPDGVGQRHPSSLLEGIRLVASPPSNFADRLRGRRAGRRLEPRKLARLHRALRRQVLKVDRRVGSVTRPESARAAGDFRRAPGHRGPDRRSGTEPRAGLNRILLRIRNTLLK